MPGKSSIGMILGAPRANRYYGANATATSVHNPFARHDLGVV